MHHAVPQLSFPSEFYDQLAEALAPRLAAHLNAGVERDDRWLSTAEAARHLGMAVSTLHRLAAQGRIDHDQDGPGCKLWFKKADLDAWRTN